MNQPLLSVRHLSKIYTKNGTSKTVLEDVSFDLYENETLALVGESASGKTTLGKIVMGLTTPTLGEVFFRGSKLRNEPRSEIQYIFQDPYSSLNPRMSVSEIVAEPLRIQGKVAEFEIEKKVEEALALVGLSPTHSKKYPAEFSGGQRQRIAIARAIITKPRCIICDEPTSSLDVSIQAQIVLLLKKLQKELNLSYLFISHDLAIVQHLAHRIAVVHNGKIVEINNVEDLFTSPSSSYTSLLIDAYPK